jgi:hypothetical protein
MSEFDLCKRYWPTVVGVDATELADVDKAFKYRHKEVMRKCLGVTWIHESSAEILSPILERSIDATGSRKCKRIIPLHFLPHFLRMTKGSRYRQRIPKHSVIIVSTFEDIFVQVERIIMTLDPRCTNIMFKDYMTEFVKAFPERKKLVEFEEEFESEEEINEGGDNADSSPEPPHIEQPKTLEQEIQMADIVSRKRNKNRGTKRKRN